MSHFKSVLKIRSDENNWAKSYLSNADSRITHRLTPILGQTFFRNYGRALVEAHADRRLLIRCKIFNPTENEIEILQIWENEKIYQTFQNENHIDPFVAAFSKANFLIRLELETINPIDVQNLLQSLHQQEIIWQFVVPEFRSSDMIIGDPLKE